MAQRRRLILGLGNRLLGDDGFGAAVVSALRRRGCDASADVRCAGTDLLDEIESFHRYEEVILVDAVLGAGTPGTVAVLDESIFGAWTERSEGAHQMSPLLAVKIFRRLYPASATRIRLVALHSDAIRRTTDVAATAVSAGVDRVEALL